MGKHHIVHSKQTLVCKNIPSPQEKDVGVTGNPIALTITWSFAMFPDSQAPISRKIEEPMGAEIHPSRETVSFPFFPPLFQFPALEIHGFKPLIGTLLSPGASECSCLGADGRVRMHIVHPSFCVKVLPRV